MTTVKNHKMTRRIRNCCNSTNFDTINCDAYLSSLANRDRPMLGQIQKCKRDRSASNIKTTSASLLIPPKSQGIRSRKQKSDSNKNVTDDTPSLVEVMVHTHTARKAHPNVSQHDRQCWSQLLKPSQSIETMSTFDSYDPLRTIHFLSKELLSKLKTISPGDPQMFEIITTIQHVLNRIPPDVISATSLLVKQSDNELCRIDNKREAPEKLIPEKKKVTSEKSCQTPPTMLTCTDSVIFQKQLEASTAKLESSCKQMEKLCIQLKEEKEHVEDLLRLEIEKVGTLRKQLDVLREEKKKCCKNAIELVTRERNELEIKLKHLKSQLNGSTIHELQTRIHTLQEQKNFLDQDNINFRHKLTASEMEKEKYVTLLNLRDRQVLEILKEMNMLQIIVNEQVTELQKTPIISPSSSLSTTIDNWSSIDTCTKAKDKPLSTLYKNEQKESQCTSSVTIVDSAASKMENKLDTLSSLSKNTILKTSSEFMQKIKESNSKDIQTMFNELTRQALVIHAELPSTSDHHFNRNAECIGVVTS